MTRHDFESLDGRTVLITGGAGHIGSAAAEAFLALGARVVTADVSGSHLTGALKESDQIRHHIVDLADPTASSGLVDLVIDDFGRLDVVVATASWMGTDSTE
ncbi:uncharacterized protein METZ01_LOCUS264652, partial [marine metagenome]